NYIVVRNAVAAPARSDNHYNPVVRCSIRSGMRPPVNVEILPCLAIALPGIENTAIPVRCSAAGSSGPIESGDLKVVYGHVGWHVKHRVVVVLDYCPTCAQHRADPGTARIPCLVHAY